MPRGRISAEQTIWCGICWGWEHLESKQPAEEARRIGWRNTRKRGWICPAHVRKVDKGADNEQD